MVSDATLEPQEVVDEVATEEVSDEAAAVETTETPEPSEQAPDPVQVLADRLGNIDQRLDGLSGLDPNRINSLLGRVPNLQSDLDAVKGQDPLATLDPRFSANETLLSALAEAFINSDEGLVNDQSKASLQAALSQLGEAQTERERVALKREVLAEVQAAATPEETETAPTGNDQWQAATLDVQAALPADFDLGTIPQEVWAEGVRTQRPSLAVRHVLNWVDSQSADALDGLAERKAAAGDGAPSASAGGTTIDTLLSKLEELGPTVLSEAELKQVDKHLGVKL